MDKAPRRRARKAEPLSRALRAAEAAESKRAEDIVILDLRDLTLVTDYFVICTGGSRVQLRAIVDGINEAMTDHAPKSRARPLREGDPQGQWVLLDFGDVVVHVFGPEARAFYRLERLWGNASVVAR